MRYITRVLLVGIHYLNITFLQGDIGYVHPEKKTYPWGKLANIKSLIFFHCIHDIENTKPVRLLLFELRGFGFVLFKIDTKKLNQDVDCLVKK